MPLQTGQIINNRYRIITLLGQGGFGAVYRAWDINLNVPVAVKENFDTSSSAARQFALEANILASIRHPNLPKVTDHFSLPDLGQFLVMEYIAGEDLTEKVTKAGGPLPESLALAWIDQILNALNYLHQQNPPIIHRDIKPDNIRITPNGQAVLVDFGVAKMFTSGQRTATAARAVTPGYSPFENYGQGPTDARSDIYAMGATLYCALTGQVPPESIDRMIGKELAPLRQLNPKISPYVEAAILKAMALLPQNRFNSAVEFGAALRSPSAPQEANPPRTTQVILTPAPVQATAYIAPARQFEAPAQPFETPDRQFEAPAQTRAAEARPSRSFKLMGVFTGIGLAAIILAAAVVFFLWLSSNIPPTPTAVSPAAVILPTKALASTSQVTIPANLEITPTTAPPTGKARPPSTLPPTRAPVSINTQPPALPPTVKPPSGPMMLNLDQGYHCRGGPQDTYEILRDLNAGLSLELIGISGDRQWYLVRLNDSSTRKKLCWVTGGVVQGNPNALPTCTWTGDGYTENYSCAP